MLSPGNGDMYVVFTIPHLYFFLTTRNHSSQWTKFSLRSRSVFTHAHNSAAAINLEGAGVKTVDEMQESVPIIQMPLLNSPDTQFLNHQNKDIKFEAPLVTVQLRRAGCDGFLSLGL